LKRKSSKELKDWKKRLEEKIGRKDWKKRLEEKIGDVELGIGCSKIKKDGVKIRG